jgi:excisionase family DNA binding protein
VSPPDQLLTADQLAVRWQMKRDQIYRLTREGTIPYVPLGRYYRYRLDLIEAWEREQAMRSNGHGTLGGPAARE